jgi:hypothetical protein
MTRSEINGRQVGDPAAAAGSIGIVDEEVDKRPAVAIGSRLGPIGQ